MFTNVIWLQENLTYVLKKFTGYRLSCENSIPEFINSIPDMNLLKFPKQFLENLDELQEEFAGVDWPSQPDYRCYRCLICLWVCKFPKCEEEVKCLEAVVFPVRCCNTLQLLSPNYMWCVVFVQNRV